MSTPTGQDSTRKPLVRLSGEIKTPPFSKEARLEAGFLLRQLQDGELIGLPRSRPMPAIGPRCHELRVRDENRNWRVIYRIDSDAILMAGVFSKTTETTPKHVVDSCRKVLKVYDEAVKQSKKRARL